MRTRIAPNGPFGRSFRGLVFALLGFCALGATGASAAPVPSPGIKVIAVTGPTHLPPRQSEVQRLTVEAEGGTFQLAGKAGEGKLTPVTRSGVVSTTEGSTEATVGSGGEALEVGARVLEAGFPFGVETFVVSCSPDCTSQGSTVIFSNPSTETLSETSILIQAKEATVEEGSFAVGDELRGKRPIFLPDTLVTAVSGSKIDLSKPPSIKCIVCSEEAVSIYEKTVPLAFDAAASTVQSAFEAVPVFGTGSVTVSGGPGGDAEHPYFFAFGGKFTDQDVEAVSVDGLGLAGAHPFIKIFTTTPGGPGTGDIYVLPANIGAKPTSGVITAKVGPLPQGVVTAGQASGIEWTCLGGAGEKTIECTSPEPVKPLRASPHGLRIPIEIESSAAPSAVARVELFGGGASEPSSYELPVVVSSEPAPFGVAAIWAGSFEADGSPSTQAGGHPYDSAAFIMVDSVRLANGALTPSGDSKDIVANLPPGFVGNPLATPRCPQNLLLEPAQGSSLCNEEDSVGNLDPFASGTPQESLGTANRLYNDMPPHGVAAEFTTRLVVPLQSVIASVNSEEDFGIKLAGPNNPNYNKIYGVFTGFEGVPALGNGRALLTNPTNCAESAAKPSVVKGEADSFQNPGKYSPAFAVDQPALTGCDKLKFEGVTPQTPNGQIGFSFIPSSEAGNLVSTGSTPVGATADVHIDNPGLTDPTGLATPELKRAVIKLPEGMSLNPSSANGLEGCSEAQIGYLGSGFPTPTPVRFNEAQPSCPGGSKLATAKIETPLLDNPLVGEVFLANQGENPSGSLLAVYLVVNDPLTGVLIKLPGEVQANPVTGRLTTIFDNNPQLPFTDLILSFRGGGPRSLFATSEVCGNFPTEGEWTPWSAPESGPPAQTSDSFNVTSNCAPSPGARPFGPSFEAGTTAKNAGGYNPLVVKIARKDGEQEISRIDFTLPKGLIGKLAGIPYCPEAAIAAAERRSGRQEQAAPSCPATSQLGTVDAGAGVGPLPFHVGGKLYLAGPYKAAPVSAVAITPAVAGPLDLGDVVIRAPLYVDHETAELTAKTDPIPTILQGIPLKIRSVAIDVNRPGFILNPTNCTPMSASATFGGGSGATAKASSRFQVAGCQGLKFAPQLKIALKGKNKRGGHPGVIATLTQPPGQANIGKVSVALPRSEFLEQGHIRTNCTRVQFAAEQCPAGSIYGHAEAITPLLDQPLTGPVYLRSSSHRLPDLAVVLKGPPSQPIEIDLDGRIDSVHGGIRTTFESVPDAPVSKFVLRLPAGKKSLLVNSTNICRGKHKARVEMTGQNGLEHNFSQLLEPKCGKKKGSKGGKKKHRKHHSHAAKPKRSPGGKS